jgi:LysM domain
VTLAYQRSAVYNLASQVLSDSTSGMAGTSSTSYGYGVNGVSYANGAVVSQSVDTVRSGVTAHNDITTSTLWRDAALQLGITNSGPGGTTSTTFTYDANAHVSAVGVTGAQARTINYTTDSTGQVMVRSQSQDGTALSPRGFSFYFNGLRVGDIGNDGSDNLDYGSTIAANGATPGAGPFRGGAVAGTAFADFDQNYGAINTSAAPETSPSVYMVRSGETLVSIAQSVWGDASLWYKLAEANGLARSDSVSAGQSLIIPSALSISHNNAATFKPYDAGKALGDIQPGAPKPPTGKKGCGAIGSLILTAMEIAMAVVLTPMVGPVAASIGANINRQIYANILGLQDGFDFKQVAIAAATAAVAQGVKLASSAAMMTAKVTQFVNAAAGTTYKVSALTKAAAFLAKGTLAANIARGALVSAATQGTLVATGLQEKFSWSGVAAAGITAGVTGSIHISGGGSRAAARFGAAAAGMAGTIAGAGTRSLLEGTDFGDNLIAVLPDAIGATLATLAIDAVAERGRERGGMGGPDGDEAGGGSLNNLANLKRQSGSPFARFATNKWLNPKYFGSTDGRFASADPDMSISVAGRPSAPMTGLDDFPDYLGTRYEHLIAAEAMGPIAYKAEVNAEAADLALNYVFRTAYESKDFSNASLMDGMASFSVRSMNITVADNGAPSMNEIQFRDRTQPLMERLSHADGWGPIFGFIHDVNAANFEALKNSPVHVQIAKDQEKWNREATAMITYGLLPLALPAFEADFALMFGGSRVGRIIGGLGLAVGVNSILSNLSGPMTGTDQTLLSQGIDGLAKLSGSDARPGETFVQSLNYLALAAGGLAITRSLFARARTKLPTSLWPKGEIPPPLSGVSSSSEDIVVTGRRIKGAGAAESATVRAASTDLVPVASKTLGEWGETRLGSFLGGQGIKPSSPFKTPLGNRYPDRLVDGISYESKAGLNVKLTSSIERQIAKDAYLINAGRIKGAEWHFWRGAQPELVQALKNAGITPVVH